MRTYKNSVFDIFQAHRRYVVPLFQRGYVWTRESQWEPLWEDVVGQTADAVRHKTSASTRLHKHFLGALVLNLTHTALHQVPIVEIIDGQQRLTTLQILLAAVRDEVSRFSNPYLKESVERLIANTGSLGSPEERFKVWPTSSMQVHLGNVVETGSLEAVEELYGRFHVFKYRKWQPPRPGVVEAYVYFANALRDYLDDDPAELPFELVELSAEQRAHELIEALIQNFQLVTIELDAEDDAQVIFETLNARGEPLTPSDLVRNFLFLTATRQKCDVTRIYNELWARYEDDPSGRSFWKQDERQGRLKRSRLDLFLFHYVVFRTSTELKIGHVYQAFRDWWESEPDRDVEVELQELARYSEIYRDLLDPDPSTPAGRSFNRLRILDTTTAYPLILWTAGELGTSSDDFLAIVRDIESFIVRRMVCGYNQKAYNLRFLEILARLREHGTPVSPETLRDMLSTSTAESAIWPSDEEFRAHLVNDPLYRSVGPRRSLMILEAIESASQHPFGEDVTVNSPLTVEHVLPQHANEEDWPLYLKDGEPWADAWTHRTNEVTHRLGNLTLLTQALNSSESNDAFSRKRPEIAKQSRLALNAYFQDAPVWDEEAIRVRGASLADLAVKIWPGPLRS